MAGETRPLPAPVINPGGGNFPPNTTVRVSIRAERGAVVIYTLDGTMPDWNRGIRTESHLVFFTLPQGDVVVRAAAYRPNRGVGTVREACFTRSSK